jgi:hypothetical protein
LVDAHRRGFRAAPDLRALPMAEQTKMFTAYVRTKAGKITLCAMPRKWRDVEETAANMSKVPDVERVSVAAYGRIIAAFKDGVRIDLEAP